jgi:hypothetical protein
LVLEEVEEEKGVSTILANKRNKKLMWFKKYGQQLWMWHNAKKLD